MIDNSGIKHLCRSIKRLSNLQSLSLGDNLYDSIGIRYLCYNFSKKIFFKTMNIHSIYII